MKSQQNIIELVTRPELYQVANYGMSGQYNTHHDAVLMDKHSRQQKLVFNIDNGDRIATVSTD